MVFLNDVLKKKKSSRRFSSHLEGIHVISLRQMSNVYTQKKRNFRKTSLDEVFFFCKLRLSKWVETSEYRNWHRDIVVYFVKNCNKNPVSVIIKKKKWHIGTFSIHPFHAFQPTADQYNGWHGKHKQEQVKDKMFSTGQKIQFTPPRHFNQGFTHLLTNVILLTHTHTKYVFR